jgi:hypothetical protein
MLPFYSRFPDLAAKETRTVTVRGDDDLPDGEYGFIEFYCDEPACDCRRVVVNVMTPHTGSTVWATISFGWGSLQYYQDRLGYIEDAAVAKGPSLDPLNPQTEYAPALLRLFRFVLTDDAYVERLKSHYHLLKGRMPGLQRSEKRPRKHKNGKGKRKK